jgi:transcriptional regulator with XRE-family HTH domain
MKGSNVGVEHEVYSHGEQVRQTYKSVPLMGVRARQRPERLGEKLLQIRLALGLSQSELIKRLGIEDIISYKKVSDYERGNREPTLPILLRYARAANVAMEAIVDDDLDLPDKMPSAKKHEGIKRKTSARGVRN